MMNPQNPKERGDEGEEIAVAFLVEQGYQIIDRNPKLGSLELDIVAKHGKEIVFVEVKSRKDEAWGDPEEYVEDVKMGRVVRAAQMWLDMRSLDEHPARFDVIAINTGVHPPVIRHYVDAFISGWNE
jgi:putative endonuclease